MKLSNALPSLPDITREALAVIAGAVLAAFVMAQFPSVKGWIKKQWE